MSWHEVNMKHPSWHRALVMLSALILISATLSILDVGRQLVSPSEAGASTVTTTVSSWSDSLSCSSWESVRIPAGVTTANYKVWGGGGAAGDNYSWGAASGSGGSGGRGALVQGTVSGLTGGNYLSAKIGCGGSDGSGSSAGYIPGGGAMDNTGGGGGAASALCFSGTSESCGTVLAIASGGGGGGRAQTNIGINGYNGGAGGSGWSGDLGAGRNAGTAATGASGSNGGNCCDGTQGPGGAGSSQNFPPDATTAPPASPSYGAGSSAYSGAWNSGGGGGGGLIGGAGARGGQNGSNYRAPGGGGGGSSWFSTSGTVTTSGSSFANAGGVTYCDDAAIGTNPGYGGNSERKGCPGYVEITWNVSTTSTTFVTQPSSTAIAGEQFAVQPVVAAVDSAQSTLAGVPITLTYSGTSSGTVTCSSNPVNTNASGYAYFSGCFLPSAGTFTIRATNGSTNAFATSQTVTISENNEWSGYGVDFNSCGTTSYSLPSTANSANFIARGAGGGAGGRDTVSNNNGRAGGTATLSGANLRDGLGALRGTSIDVRVGCGGGGGQSSDPATANGGSGGSGWGAGGAGGSASGNTRNLGGGGGGGGTGLCFTSCVSGGIPLTVAGGGGGSGGSYDVPGGTGGSPGGSASSTNQNWYGTGAGSGSVANGGGGGTGSCGTGGGGGTTSGGGAGSGCGGSGPSNGSGSSAAGGGGGTGGSQGSSGNRRTGGGGGGGGYFGGGGGGQDYQNSGDGAGGGGGAGSSWVNTGIGGSAGFSSTGGGSGGVAQNKNVTGGPGGAGSARIELAGTAVMVTPPSNQSSTVGTAGLSLAISSTFSTVGGKLGPLTWTQTGLPAGMSINPSTGTITGTAPTLAGTHSITVKAATNSASSGISPPNTQLSKSVTFTWTFVPASPYKLVFTSSPVVGPANETANLGPITVQRQDQYGNVTTPGTSTTVNLASNSTGTAVFAATANGSALTTLTIPAWTSTVVFYYGDTKMGTPTITASGLTTNGTQTASIGPAADDRLVLTQGPENPSPVAEDLSMFVEVHDRFGNRTESTATVTVAVSTGGGTLSGTTSVQAEGGTAEFNDVRFGHSGLGYKLQFTAPGLTATPETSSFDVVVFARNGMELRYLGDDPALSNNTAVPGSGVAAVDYYYCNGFSGGSSCALIGTSTASASQFALTWNIGLPPMGPAVGSHLRIVTVPTDRVANARSSAPADLGSAPSTPVKIIP